MSVSTDENVKALLNLLEVHENEIIMEWFGGLSSEQKSLNPEEHIRNAKELYALIKRGLVEPDTKNELKEFAYRLADERSENHNSIGAFVYDAISGRSVLYKYIYQWGISFYDSYLLLDNINKQFDYFCYYTVIRYTEIKEQELHEKVLYINQTHKDRLSLLGQMSSSFVHEFRNPLTAIMGFIKLLKTGPQNQMYLDVIDHELQQLNFRITQFLHTSRMEIHEKRKKEVLVPKMISDILNFIYPSIVGVDCEITANIDSNVKIMAYEDELKQVLQNILLNSIEALKDKEKPRKILVDCHMEKDQAMIRISNNGAMIPPKIIETIFEPFFTTKELGTGIGLYVCRKIIEKHKGNIVCESNKDWTSFSIYLPIEVYIQSK